MDATRYDLTGPRPPAHIQITLPLPPEVVDATTAGLGQLVGQHVQVKPRNQTRPWLAIIESVTYHHHARTITLDLQVQTTQPIHPHGWELVHTLRLHGTRILEPEPLQHNTTSDQHETTP